MRAVRRARRRLPPKASLADVLSLLWLPLAVLLLCPAAVLAGSSTLPLTLLYSHCYLLLLSPLLLLLLLCCLAGIVIVNTKSDKT